ncbi:stage VI sporulation protein F [Paenibacillus aceris]|uniref:Aromatic ring hydroxylase n=1 Tax=Paenibacillus aceris TaxID=869555 RepID=A0ABS4HRN8_9BACL|nr:stage VI sporulation protein F [Paenibacillus aceris]MBP1961215.1 aromatic ring hydroxylase [Paenibacillus aceris]NHW37995.1 serine/threonine protein kinase [Paenibacillus aceris]
MSYQQYGIDPALIERVKFKLRNPEIKERIKMLLQGVTKADLQNRTKVTRLIGLATGILGEKLTGSQANQMLEFILAQKIDPSNTFHLIKLWSMFR